MGYCILRMAKLKSRASLVRALQHNTRERQPSNADPDRTQNNVISAKTADAMAQYDKKLPAHVRKNAVHAVEIVITLSPDSWDDLKLSDKALMAKKVAYLKDAANWAHGVLGGKQNLLCGTVHTDERTDHLHIIMMPLKDGKLNAKHYIGGHRDRMRELQDDFYEKVGKKHDLERGRPREETLARHQDIKTYYAKLDEFMRQEQARQVAFSRAEQARLRQIKDRGGIER